MTHRSHLKLGSKLPDIDKPEILKKFRRRISRKDIQEYYKLKENDDEEEEE